MTYWYPLDDVTNSSCAFYDGDVRHLIATRRMNEHDWKHCLSCFIDGKECHFHFPRQNMEITKFEGDNDEETKNTLWRSLEKDDLAVSPFLSKIEDL